MKRIALSVLCCCMLVTGVMASGGKRCRSSIQLQAKMVSFYDQHSMEYPNIGRMHCSKFSGNCKSLWEAFIDENKNDEDLLKAYPQLNNSNN